MYYGDKWDPSNDWSLQGMEDIGEDYDNIVGGVDLAKRCPYVCVYADGKLVGGTEPDGTKPDKVYTVAQLTRLYQHLLTQRPFDSADVAAQFDFNGDKCIDIRDATLLKRLILK